MIGEIRQNFTEASASVGLILATALNRRKAIFNWAAKGLFFLRGGGGYTHSGYHKTLSATIACNRISCESET